MKKKHPSFKNKFLFLGIVGGAVCLFTFKKVFDLAAPPEEPKLCDFIYPSSEDQTKPNTLLLQQGSLDLVQEGGVINDASCLNQTAIYGVVEVRSEEDVKTALSFARENELKVTPAGQRHSMGGQSFLQSGLVLDMRTFNAMSVNEESKILHVQSGATWQEVQEYLDGKGLAVKAMQSINIFTVGGTLSVNAHGVAHDPGPIGSTVQSLHLMLSTGEVVKASPTENPDLFRLALGGYGLAGVILDVDLEVVDNALYELKTEYMDYKDFGEYYKENIKGNSEVGLFYARLSVSPTSYLRETAIHRYDAVEATDPLPDLQPDEHDWMNRLVINFSKTGPVGRWVRWFLEKNVEPRVHRCSRNEAMSTKEVCLVTRNQEMYDSMGYLKNRLSDTDILQEYFVPQDKMAEFVDGLRGTVTDTGANLLNVTIRIVSKDTVTALPYAKEDMFAFVLYFNQKLTLEGSQTVQKTTTQLIDLATSLGGTYYLPYQLYYSSEQLRAAYPEMDEFFAEKQRVDPEGLFSNTFYEKYGPDAWKAD